MEPQLPVLSLARGTGLIWMVSTMVYSVRLCTSCDLHEPKELTPGFTKPLCLLFKPS